MNAFLLANESDPTAVAVSSAFAASADLPELQTVVPDEMASAELADGDVLIVGESAFESLDATDIEGVNLGLVQLLGCHPPIPMVDHLAQSGVAVAGVSPAMAQRVANRVVGFGGPLRVRAEQGPPIWGIVGFGFTGIEVARKLKSGGAIVNTAEIRTPITGALNELEVRRLSLDLLMAGSDAITLHVLPGPTADPLITDRELKLMKSGASLINTSDQSVVDETAVLAALVDGPLGGYATDRPGDVIAEADDALKESGKLIITTNPLSRQIGAAQQIARFVAENIMAASKGTSIDGLINPVDFPIIGDPSFWSSRMSPRQ